MADDSINKLFNITEPTEGEKVAEAFTDSQLAGEDAKKKSEEVVAGSVIPAQPKRVGWVMDDAPKASSSASAPEPPTALPQGVEDEDAGAPPPASGLALAPVEETPVPTPPATDPEYSSSLQNAGMASESAQIVPRATLLERLRNALDLRKAKRLAKIMEYAVAQGSVSNDEVEKLLRVSHATATRYLRTLLREGKVQAFGSASETRYTPLQ